MAWFRVEEEAPNHPKIGRLARELGIERAHAWGLASWLWLYCFRHAKNGDLTLHDPRDIAHALYWSDEPDRLMKALQMCGLLDGFLIHDWEEHGAPQVARLADSRSRAQRSRDTVRAACAQRARTVAAPTRRDDTRTGEVVVGETGIERCGEAMVFDTKKEKRPPLPPRGAWPGFSEFWSAYPKRCPRRDRAAAAKAWDKLKPPLPEVIAALVWQDKSDDWTKDDGAFIPSPTVWINQRRWEREQPTTGPPPRRKPRLSSPAHWQDRLLAGDKPETWINWDEMATRATKELQPS